MPSSALFSAAIEQAINGLLSLDSDSKARLSGLNGMRLYLFIDPLPNAICLVFSTQVDVLTEYDDHDDVVAKLDDKSCCIQTRLSTLPSLKDTNQLTRLIQQGELTVDGALSVAQQVSGLFQHLDIDIEEIIATNTNDVFAHSLVSAAKTVSEKVRKGSQVASRVLGNALVEEKQLAAHRLAVMHFSDNVNALRDDMARLESRLNKLESFRTKS